MRAVPVEDGKARWRILHAIHDYLPRHTAGSEIYLSTLCRELSCRHSVSILCTDYDPALAHGDVVWRVHQGVPVAEIINNWVGESFEDTYRSPLITRRIEQVLDAVQPHIVHVHSLLNLSFDLPRLALARGVPVVATLHDYTLVCPSGGQRVHRAESHLCRDIDPDRCARCFPESPFGARVFAAPLVARASSSRLVRSVARTLRARAPAAARAAATIARVASARSRPEDVTARLAAAAQVMHDVDLWVAPSAAIASEFVRLGMPPERVRVSDYGVVALEPRARAAGSRLRIGYVGTLVWHKGVHALIEAVRDLPPEAVELKVFGDPDVFADYAAHLRQLAAGAPVRFMGAFDRAQVADTYGQMDVLVVPSLWLENSPLVIHEAFMAGVPVIGSRLGGTADLIRDGENGLLYDPDAPGALSAALRTVIEQPGLLDRFRADLPAVKSIEQDAREWEARYAEVLDRSV